MSKLQMVGKRPPSKKARVVLPEDCPHAPQDSPYSRLLQMQHKPQPPATKALKPQPPAGPPPQHLLRPGTSTATGSTPSTATAAATASTATATGSAPSTAPWDRYCNWNEEACEDPENSDGDDDEDILENHDEAFLENPDEDGTEHVMTDDRAEPMSGEDAAVTLEVDTARAEGAAARWNALSSTEQMQFRYIWAKRLQKVAEKTLAVSCSCPCKQYTMNSALS